jgi:hypothetical protein
MRSPNAEFFELRFLKEFGSGANRVAQDAIDQRSISPTGQLHGFENCGVLRSLEEKQLIEAQPEQIARIMVDMTGPELADPKIEQDQVPQNTVEKFGDKGAIGSA